jgi:hypothetical protein
MRDRVGITAVCRVTAWIAMIVLGVAVASASGATWSVDNVPLPPSIGAQLEAVSCPSASACTAVGYTLQSGRTLAERWNGRSWVHQPSPNPLPGHGGTLSGVSCPSSSSCVAVGSDGSGDRTLVERWTGARWSIVETGHAGSLDAVSCPTTHACVAVGSDAEYSYCCVTTMPVAMGSSGGAWVASPVAARPSWVDAWLSAVSCSSRNACTAVGSFDVGAGCRNGGRCTESPLLERWNGRRWFIASPPSVSRAASPSLTAVWCASPWHCVVLGYLWDPRGRGSAFAATGTGSRWSLTAIPAPPGTTAIFPEDLSCLTLGNCTAVGNVVDRRGRVSLLVADRTGSRWTIPHVPIPADAGPTFLDGVSCASRVVCVAVGTAGDQPLVARSS